MTKPIFCAINNNFNVNLSFSSPTLCLPLLPPWPPPPPNRKFYYITLLRDPVSRYLSEWRHVQRGATWKTSLHMCDGRTPTPEELPSCYEGSDWSGCTLQQFMDCPYNLANNRQVQRKESKYDEVLPQCRNSKAVQSKPQEANVLYECHTVPQPFSFALKKKPADFRIFQHPHLTRNHQHRELISAEQL